jgi:hypothetical protein
MFEEVLGIWRVCGNLSQVPHSDAIGTQLNPKVGLALEATNFEAFPCVWMLGFRPQSQRETKEARLQNHSQRIRWL